jgi:two-component system phosphate regulon sensor histidine kinase PhoR
MSSSPALIRSRFFWNLFLSLAAVLLGTGLVIDAVVEPRLRGERIDELRRTLAGECDVLAPFLVAELEAGRGDQLAARVPRREEQDRRVTIIAPDGRVLADSHEDPAAMDDHSRRPEVVQARSEPFGSARRHSHTLDLDMLYVARRLSGADGGLLGFVRVSVSVAQVRGELWVTRRAVLAGSAIGILGALVATFALSRRITRPLAEITASARRIAAGDHSSRVRMSRQDEIGQLGEALNELGAQIAHRIADLSREDAQLRAMLAGMVEGVVAVDREDRVAFMNQAARVLLDVGESRPEQRTLWDLAPIRELEELLVNARTNGGAELREIDLHRGGRERVFQAHVSPFRDGDQEGHVLVLHDTTELRRLERVRRDFVANVSHELKTPLTTIQGFVETLLSGALHDPEHNERFLRRIEANVKRLTALVADLLSLARIESGQVVVERRPVDWQDVLEDVLRLRESALQGKKLALDLSRARRGTRVRGDREAMTQVLDNLIDNAIQYTAAPGRIEVVIEATGSHGVLAVRDTGMGIPEVDLDRIFERFYRVDKARSRAAGGTGLGLSIVKNLVVRMGGEVRVASREGEGSTFTVLLPLA